MARKILLGMAVVAGICAIAASGYRFGQHLRQSSRVQAEQALPAVAAQPSNA